MTKIIEKTCIVALNLCDSGSSGSIMRNALEYAKKTGNYDYEVVVPYDEGKLNTFAIYSSLNKYEEIFVFSIIKKSKLRDSFLKFIYTRNVIKRIRGNIKKYRNVIVHIHTIHSINISYTKLFRFLSHNNIKTVFTMHDLWAITGGCPCYSYINCYKWMENCKNCPKNYKDSSKILIKKTKYLNKINNLIFAPVSNYVRQEFLKSYLKNKDSVVVYGEVSLRNIIDNKKKDELRQKLSLGHNKIVLSVSAYWNDWKGVSYLYRVADKLPDDYILLVVGGYFNVKGYKNIIHVGNVDNKTELPYYYSIADVFVSVTQSEALSLVLIESQLCGCPIVGFGHGGTPETITENSGIMTGTDNDVDKLVHEIIHVVENKPFNKEDIIKSGKRFEQYTAARKYFDIYEKIVNK